MYIIRNYSHNMPAKDPAKTAISTRRYRSSEKGKATNRTLSLQYYHKNKAEVAARKALKKEIDHANLMNLLGIEVPVPQYPSKISKLLESLPQ